MQELHTYHGTRASYKLQSRHGKITVSTHFQAGQQNVWIWFFSSSSLWESQRWVSLFEWLPALLFDIIPVDGASRIWYRSVQWARGGSAPDLLSNLSALEQSWLQDSHRCFVSLDCSFGWLGRPLPLARLILSLSIVTVTNLNLANSYQAGQQDMIQYPKV